MAKVVLSTGKFTFKPITMTAAATDIVTITAHDMPVNDIVRFETTNTLPDPLAVDTDYYIKTVESANTVTLSASKGGAVVNITDTGTGTHKALKQWGVTGLSSDEESAEVDTTDTGTTAGTTEGLAGRKKVSFSVSIIKDVAVNDISLRSAQLATIDYQGKKYSGTAILYTKSNGVEVDGRIEQTYNGAFNGTVTES